MLPEFVVFIQGNQIRPTTIKLFGESPNKLVSIWTIDKEIAIVAHQQPLNLLQQLSAIGMQKRILPSPDVLSNILSTENSLTERPERLNYLRRQWTIVNINNTKAARQQ
jgi:hypothetical protein